MTTATKNTTTAKGAKGARGAKGETEGLVVAHTVMVVEKNEEEKKDEEEEEEVVVAGFAVTRGESCCGIGTGSGASALSVKINTTMMFHNP